MQMLRTGIMHCEMELCIFQWNYALWNGIMHFKKIYKELCIMHIGIMHFCNITHGIMHKIWCYELSY